MSNNLPNDIKKKPGRPKKKIKKLTEKQSAFVASYIETGSKSIALKEAGYSPNMRANDVCNADVQNAIIMQVNKVLHQYAPTAVHNMIDLSENSLSEAIKFNATKDILDRAGFKPIEKREVTGSNGLPIEARVTHELIQRYMKSYENP